MPNVIRVQETEDHRILFKLYGQEYEVIVEKNKDKKAKDGHKN